MKFTAQQVIDLANSTGYIAIDTEFVREKTYYPILCLIQIAAGEAEAIIDPIKNEDIEILSEILTNPEIVKIFHSGSQDVEILQRLLNLKINNIFDSQIAASFIGLGDSIAYAALVGHFFDVQLDKTSRNTNWEQRPLSQAQIDYAISDVTYLRDLYPDLLKMVSDKNRLAWMQRETQKLYDNLQDAESFRRIKGSRNANSKTLHILRQVWGWRENMAIYKNIPRRWIISDENLYVIAEKMPQNITDLDRLRLRGEKLSDKMRHSLLIEIRAALEKEQSEWPEVEDNIILDRDKVAILDLLKILLQVEAEKAAISARLIASNEELTIFLQNNGRCPDDPKEGIFWDKAKKLINGELQMKVMNGNIAFLED